MRPAHPPRLVPLAFAVLMLTSAACSAATPSSDVGTTSAPSGSAGPAAVVSAAPSAAPSGSAAAASPSAASASGAPATPSAAPAATPRPTPKPTPRPTSAPSGYQCVNLLHNSEVRSATGLTDATLRNNRNGTPQATGQTYCPYVAQSGQVTIAAAVWTGASYSNFLNLWNSVATYSQQAPGIGSQAIIDAGDGVGLAIVGKIGVSIQIKGPSGVPAGVDAQTACQTLLKLLAKRV